MPHYRFIPQPLLQGFMPQTQTLDLGMDALFSMVEINEVMLGLEVDKAPYLGGHRFLGMIKEDLLRLVLDFQKGKAS